MAGLSGMRGDGRSTWTISDTLSDYGNGGSFHGNLVEVRKVGWQKNTPPPVPVKVWHGRASSTWAECVLQHEDATREERAACRNHLLRRSGRLGVLLIFARSPKNVTTSAVSLATWQWRPPQTERQSGMG